jgi:hypothetical protein
MCLGTRTGNCSASFRTESRENRTSRTHIHRRKLGEKSSACLLKPLNGALALAWCEQITRTLRLIAVVRVVKESEKVVYERAELGVRR